jgi:hypothetical protein
MLGRVDLTKRFAAQQIAAGQLARFFRWQVQGRF